LKPIGAENYYQIYAIIKGHSCLLFRGSQKEQLQDIEAGVVATVQKDLLRSSSLLIRWAKA
jgi:hypothetical protein